MTHGTLAGRGKQNREGAAMRKLFLMLLLAVVSRSAMADTWKYTESKDEMRSTVTKYATNESINSVNFDFPYQGEQHGTIELFDKTVNLLYQKGAD